MTTLRNKAIVEHGYTLHELLGEGSFGTVYRCTNKNNFTVVADKIIPCTKANIFRFVQREYNFLSKHSHDNVVQFIALYHDDKFIHLMTQYCELGNLRQYILKYHKLTESMTRYFMQQLAQALAFVHESGYCHMDIKPHNLLLTAVQCSSEYPPGTIWLKLADFGLTVSSIPSSFSERNRMDGTMYYMAPEKIRMEPFDERIDLWSTGMVMYECLYGHHYFQAKSNTAVKSSIRAKDPIILPQAPPLTSKCRSLLIALLRYSPNERLQFDEFFDHPFIELDCLPTTENYKRASKLAQEAIDLEKAQRLDEALPKYHRVCSMLQVFEDSETNLPRKHTLKSKRIEYETCIARLIVKIGGVGTDGPESRCTSFLQQDYKTLTELAQATPRLLQALEIGRMGEYYCAENQRALARTYIMDGVEIIIEVLKSEPAGVRRKKLLQLVDHWMRIAETQK